MNMKAFIFLLVVIQFTQGVYGQQRLSTRSPDCTNVICLQPDCPNPMKPRGECCARCATRPDHCAGIMCDIPNCPDYITLPGDCCPSCPTPPVNCAAVLCANPQCPHPITPPGQCCPLCPTGGVKPGRCPRPVWSGMCVDMCRSDYSCTGRKKCCSNGCGRTCTWPVMVVGSGHTCLHRGKVYKDGEEFRVDCNICLCSNRKVICTPTTCPECHLVDCMPLTCANQYVPEGQCCPTCGSGPIPKPCFHKGKIRQHGESFKDDCNTCACSNGRLGCTLMACFQKQGTCPLPGLEQIGICMWLCDGDSTCLGNKKCCKNGCGDTCMSPQVAPPVGKPCFLHGEVLQHGETFRHDCNSCRCSNGRVGACTRIGCLQKPGKCPLPGPSTIGICQWLCNGDASCSGNGKCCSNNCGDMCMKPDVTAIIPVGKPCFHNGIIRDDGERFMDDCNNCWCSDGRVSCTKRGCRLPVASVAVQSVDPPVIGDDLFAVGGVDPPVDPLMLGGGYPDNMVPVLQGEPQMVLGGYPKPDCRGIVCGEVYCDDQSVPVGQCCNACPRPTISLK